MELTFWYSVAVAALFVLLLIRTIGLCIAESLITWIKVAIFRYIWHALLVRRRYWGSVTRAQGVLITFYVILNGISMGLGIHNSDDLIIRTGSLASINLIPLFLGGRTSILAEVLGISLHSYYLAHHWVGRVVVLQGLLHACLVVARGDPWTFNVVQISGISAASAMALLMVTSLYIVRRAAYEIFLKLHFVLGIAAVVALLNHLTARGFVRFVYPTVALILWTINSTIRVLRMIYFSGRCQDLETNASIQPFKRPDQKTTTAVQITIKLQRPFKRLGQYYYIFFSDLGLRRRFQAHPFVACWWDSTESSLSFLVQPQKGLTRALVTRSSLYKVLLDGPYGQDLRLYEFDTVFLVAKGIGIAGVLPHALQLLEYKNHTDKIIQRKVVTRCVNLQWVLEEECQMEWVSSWITQLKRMNEGKLILSIFCYFPPKNTVEEVFPESLEKVLYRDFYGKQPKIKEIIEQEVLQSPGRSTVTVCGDTQFSTYVRGVVLDMMTPTIDLSFVEADFHPQDNPYSDWNSAPLMPKQHSTFGDLAPKMIPPRRTLRRRLATFDEDTEMEDLESKRYNSDRSRKLIRRETTL